MDVVEKALCGNSAGSSYLARLYVCSFARCHKYITDELPEMGNLLGPDVLPSLIVKALGFFSSTLENAELQAQDFWSERVSALRR